MRTILRCYSGNSCHIRVFGQSVQESGSAARLVSNLALRSHQYYDTSADELLFSWRVVYVANVFIYVNPGEP